MPVYSGWTSKPIVGAELVPSHPLAVGLLDAWPNNEGSGLSVYSAGSSGTVGTLNASVSWGSSQLGPSLRFASGGVVMTTGSLYNWERTQPWSFSWWFSLSSLATTQAFISTQADSVSNLRGIGFLFLTGTNNLRVGLVNGSGNQIAFNSNTTFATNTLYHAVVTYDGSSKVAGTTIFINGNKDTTTLVEDTLAATIVSTTPLQFGARGDLSRPFVGTLSDITAWNRVLTAGEVSSLYGQPWQFYANPYAWLAKASAAAAFSGVARNRIVNIGGSGTSTRASLANAG